MASEEGPEKDWEECLDVDVEEARGRRKYDDEQGEKRGKRRGFTEKRGGEREQICSICSMWFEVNSRVCDLP